jgi:xylulokinase
MKQHLLLGYDIGSSSVKASLIDADSGILIAAAFSPKQEMKIDSAQIGWAEQHPEMWWKNLVIVTKKIISEISNQDYEILAIGISYQMHGLVMVDKNLEVLHQSIIWCDSRAVSIGEKAYADLGSKFCLQHLLNSPGNFTASKIKWVKDNLNNIYSSVYKIMLPGDYIALKLSGKTSTTIPGLSEGIMWDFSEKKISSDLLNYFGFDYEMIPEIVPTFGKQAKLSEKSAKESGLTTGIPISYRAGDQPNNALSLNVLSPGEVAATAGTSGVIYGVTECNVSDIKNRVNTFAHVNYSTEHPRAGVLLCINGTGIQYSWLKQNVFNNQFSYDEMNQYASEIKIGCDGLMCFPFGNGAERMLTEKNIGAHFTGINFNIHKNHHLIRASQEGIAFAFRYGLDVMRELGMNVKVIKSGNSNLFQSNVFKEAFVNVCNVDLEIYNTDGAQGAARGAGIGIGYYNYNSAFVGLKKINQFKKEDSLVKKYEDIYQNWKENLVAILNKYQK